MRNNSGRLWLALFQIGVGVLIAVLAGGCASQPPASSIGPSVQPTSEPALSSPSQTQPASAVPATSGPAPATASQAPGPGNGLPAIQSGPLITPAIQTSAGSPGQPLIQATVPASRAAPLPVGGGTVTLEQNQSTVSLHPGERFLLKLGDEYNWEVIPSDPAVLSRVINVMVVKGAQGLYEAHTPGTTVLTATGDPGCRASKPPCAMPSRVFQVTVIVN